MSGANGDIPPIVRNKAAAAGATAWVDELPDLIARLAEAWDLTIGRAYDGGTEAFVAQADLSDGTEAVLKLLVPRGGRMAEAEITALRLADGAGCARLLRHDGAAGALLLERLGPSMYDLGLPIGARHEALCAAAMAFWRPAIGSGLMTGAAKAQWLADGIIERWERLGRPCSERAVDQAFRFAARRAAAHDDERAVLVHGDVHQWNALAAPGDGLAFKLVDPDGLLAAPEYDLGIIMREDPVELLQGDPHDRAHRLAARTGLDMVAVWEWGVIERVSTGLLCAEIDLQPVGRQMLAAADAVAGHARRLEA